MKKLLIAALAAVAAALPAATPAQAPPLDPDETLVEEFVVQGRLPGPAWWRVSDADTTVYVLGVPSAFPKGLGWNTVVLERRLAGASQIVLPFNEIKVGLADIPGSLLGLAGIRTRNMSAELAAPVRARFEAARAALGKDEDRYRHWKPFVAALMLVSDFRDSEKITAADPAKTIRRMAEARGVKVVMKRYSAGPLIRSAARISPAGGQACMADALTEVEAGAARVRIAGEGWAAGDVRTALSQERGFERCLAAVPGAEAFKARLKAVQAAAIARALKTPGHAVAVVQLRPLLAQDGVLARLRAQGFKVLDPGQPDPDARPAA
ncbi:MAG: TraB/GumN family protein [Caulobacteraceae bacterium]|nr:TraB/GumN family protein [Caulobacteraceae bacterium]